MAEDDRAQPLAERKTRDRALILLILGVMLLLSPLASIFEVQGRVLGLPVIWLYIFAVWGLLIAGAAWLSSRLGEEPEGRERER